MQLRKFFDRWTQSDNRMKWLHVLRTKEVKVKMRSVCISREQAGEPKRNIGVSDTRDER